MEEEKWIDYLGKLAEALECDNWNFDESNGHYVFWYNGDICRHVRRTWEFVRFTPNSDGNYIIQRTQSNDKLLLMLLLQVDIITASEYVMETESVTKVENTGGKQVYGDRDTLILAYISNKYKRRTISSLIKQTGLSKIEIELSLQLNRVIWNKVKGCKGDMYEMDSVMWEELMNENR